MGIAALITKAILMHTTNMNKIQASGLVECLEHAVAKEQTVHYT